MSILYVTSFNEKLYNISGLKLISTFIQFKHNAKLLICYECEKNNNYLKDIINLKNPSLLFVNITKYKYLRKFLKNHHDLILKQYGGTRTKIESKWINKWPLWFRKIASLKYAFDNFNTNDYIIWIDSDCYFKKKIENDYLEKAFDGKECFYYLGNYRKNLKINAACGIESGFIGWKKGDGYQLLRNIINEYNDRKFTKYPRWDDGYIMREIILKSPIKTIDLSENIDVEIEVIGVKCYFKDHIIHNKGVHHKKEKEDALGIKNHQKLKNILKKAQ